MALDPRFLSALLAALACTSACDARVAAQRPAAAALAAPAAEPDPEGPRADAALEPWRAELLEIAFRAASAFPRVPHAKNRSKAQEQVVQACLALGELERAARWIPAIEDWRRGTAWADLGRLHAKAGAEGEARRYVAQAERALAAFPTEGAEDAPQQGWRRDRIRAHLARAWLALGERERARAAGADLADSEAGVVAAEEARRVAEADFDAHVAALDREAAANVFDRLRGVLDAYAELHARFYADPERRALLEARVRAASAKMPAPLRIELLARLAEAALAHADAEGAAALVAEAEALHAAAPALPLEHALPLRARLAALVHRAGDAEGARTRARAALEAFHAERAQVADVWRAGALRPLAEAFVALGERESALAVYRLAVEEGVHNPNSRPRAEDLAATCCSLAIQGLAPDDELLARLRGICAGLGEPW